MPIKSNNTAQSVVTPQAMRESVSVTYPEMEGDLFLMESARLNREILTEATSILNEMENGSTSSSSSDKDSSGSIGPSGKPNGSTPSISSTNPNSSNPGGK